MRVFLWRDGGATPTIENRPSASCAYAPSSGLHLPTEDAIALPALLLKEFAWCCAKLWLVACRLDVVVVPVRG